MSSRYTIELPVAVGRRLAQKAKQKKRKPSELAVEVLRTYVALPDLPEEKPTKSELRAIRRGEAAFARGDYVTLDDLRREESLGRRSRRTRAKVS